MSHLLKRALRSDVRGGLDNSIEVIVVCLSTSRAFLPPVSRLSIGPSMTVTPTLPASDCSFPQTLFACRRPFAAGAIVTTTHHQSISRSSQLKACGFYDGIRVPRSHFRTPKPGTHLASSSIIDFPAQQTTTKDAEWAANPDDLAAAEEQAGAARAAHSCAQDLTAV